MIGTDLLDTLETNVLLTLSPRMRQAPSRRAAAPRPKPDDPSRGGQPAGARARVIEQQLHRGGADSVLLARLRVIESVVICRAADMPSIPAGDSAGWCKQRGAFLTPYAIAEHLLTRARSQERDGRRLPRPGRVLTGARRAATGRPDYARCRDGVACENAGGTVGAGAAVPSEY